MKRVLCPPAQATSRARFAACWPCTIAQVHGILRGFAEHELRVDVYPLKGLWGIHQIHGLRQGLQCEHVDSIDHCGFPRFVFGHRHGLQPLIASRDGGGKRAAHRTDATIERQFAQKHHLVENFAKELPLTTHHAQSHGQVAAGAFLAEIGGRQINGYASAVGELKSAVVERGFDAFAALFYRIVGQIYRVEVLHVGGAYVHFDFNGVSVDAIYRRTDGLEEHTSMGNYLLSIQRNGEQFARNSWRI